MTAYPILKWMVASVFLLGLVSGAPQVLSEIDTYDDLLAIESQFIENEIEPNFQKILPAPTGFNGERFSAPPLSFTPNVVPAAPSNNVVFSRPSPVRPRPVASVPSQPARNSPINSNDIHSYSFSFETPGMKRDEQGSPKGPDSYVQTGGWEYVGDDGRVYSVRFIADENGFRPVGSHLPTPPPLPPALQRFEDARNGRLSKQRSQG
uniref:Cuticle protein CP14.6 n=1 Tax=Caligus clemensi TaxID=344056 RepID=C1C0T2_CALCM|nr:Cuticle protein CP14.6 precursor [Caligus clemensi]